jgi:ubiquinone biosynthesis monooxygenase Coq7
MYSTKNKKNLTSEERKILEEIIRVDHAGEHGATQIYRGQMAVFKKNSAIWKKILEMAEQEEVHKSTFDELIVDMGVRPTSLFPLWNKAGYLLGLGTALLGEKAAMACTVAVEEVIGRHYEEQVEILTKNKINPKLLKTIKQFREDELEHHDTGVSHEAEMTPGFVFLSKAIKQACYLAIKVTKKY